MAPQGNDVKRILIVDDEHDLREALKTTLSYDGFFVTTAENGEEGLAKALAEKPDLILLDIVMPKMDGIGVLKALRKDVWGKDARVIVMTALDDMERISEVLENGGKDYIVKSSVTLSAIAEHVKGLFENE